MPTTLTPNKTDAPPPGGGGFDDFGGGGDGGRGGGGWSNERTPPPEGYSLAIRLSLISITVLFLALSSAYVFNNAMRQPIPAPHVLWVSTSLILLSSLTAEMARRALRRRMENRFKFWISATMLFGLCFLGAQLILWRKLVASGFYVNRNFRSGYAYIFTGLHGAHLIGGLVALGYVMLRERGKWTAVRRRVSVDATVLYWHFLDGLWIYLLALIFYWR
ncbi:MAG TPA: cytochrome c oxidase subunit 3 [Blastocatellia bacterium]|nr:cytochrome c oxidase subunit 3 [Blastocatellia bacterium]